MLGLVGCPVLVVLRGFLCSWRQWTLNSKSLIAPYRGNISLPKQFPFLGHTQLEVLSLLSGLLLLLTHGVTVCTVRERVLMEPSKSVAL